jgi:hypothetical protein
MKTHNSSRDSRNLCRSILLLCILIIIPGVLQSVSGNDNIKFNHEFKLKRISGETVSVYTINEKGQKQEYFIKDFNADVLLLVYRNIDVDHITENLSRKYHLRKIDCRRQVKMALNTLAEWDIILRT